ncbi:uncharacterized protein K452DRAFT_287291 [Aplosporella prunicola CBS 121167]|uniref:Uncharacterized protein n=1 Tax=Aplosporella prunicola CBS 121167 TaxID=1176127 RepID=A0A6A6BEU9_9PEZI|nr:uncharacterized protein K452DRAFT_287291 [Aplosporella prunicola CBS 121167]KAF2142088.1 hypothetical protein K452DRAFT_287291 [Aplosporella prunicola CBS 121167]
MKQTLRSTSSTNSSSKNIVATSKSSKPDTTSKGSSSSRTRSPTRARRLEDQSSHAAATHAARNAYTSTAVEVKEREHRVREKGRSKEGESLGKGTMRKEAHRAGESLYGEEARKRYAQREKSSDVFKGEFREAKGDVEVLVNAAKNWAAKKQGHEESKKKEELKSTISRPTVEVPQKKKTSFDVPRTGGILGRSLSRKDKDGKTPTTAKSAIDNFMRRLQPDPRRDSDASFGCVGITDSQVELAQPLLQAAAVERTLASQDFRRPITPPELKRELFGRKKKHETVEMAKPLNVRKVTPVADEQIAARAVSRGGKKYDSVLSNMTGQTDVSSLRASYEAPPPPPPKDSRSVDKHRKNLRTSDWI